MTQIVDWHDPCFNNGMWEKTKRLFVIKTKFEASLIIYALALGAMERGKLYLVSFPGNGGYLLMAACSGAVFLAGAKIFDALRLQKQLDKLQEGLEQPRLY